MVWRISAGVGRLDGHAPPPGVVRRDGGLARSWGARLACLTRRGSPLMSSFASGLAAGEPGSDPPGASARGPVWRESSQGGPEAFPGRGEATGVIGVGGTGGPAPGTPRSEEGPAVVWAGQAGERGGWARV